MDPSSQSASHSSPSPSFNRAATAFAESSSADWSDEKKLLAALAILQDLDNRVQNLRTLFPTRLLHPLEPLVDPHRESLSNPTPKRPMELCVGLKNSVTEGLAELDAFKRDFTSDTTRAVFARVGEVVQSDEAQTRTQGGNPVWTRLYDANLKAYLHDEERQRKEEERKEERERLVRDVEAEKGRWRDVVTTLGTQFDGMEVTIPQSQEQMQDQGGKEVPRFDVRYTRSSMMLRFRWWEPARKQGDGADDDGDVQMQGGGDPGEWYIVDESRSFERTALRKSIVDAVKARQRKWDIAYLITLLASFTSHTPQPCAKCNNLLDGHAHLALARKDVLDDSVPGGIKWLPYHPGCL